jgi:hypothetical protein
MDGGKGSSNANGRAGHGETVTPPAPPSANLDRRRHARLPWRHHHLDPLLLEVEEPGSDWRPVECTLVDLAIGGVGVLVAEPLDAGSRVRVTFPLPDSLEPQSPETPIDIAPWSALAEVVHARHIPDRAHDHVPQKAHLPHHRGVRFQDLENDAEGRLLRALYGPLPAGWGVEQYRVKSGKGWAARYAVVQDGKRVAWGFGSYERARGRALSMHMDAVAAARKPKPL